MLGYFLCFLSSADFTWSGSKLFTKVISRWHLYIKSVIRRPYQLAPRAAQTHVHGIDQFAPVRHGGDKSRALYNCRYTFQYLTSGPKIVHARVRTRWTKYLSHFGKFVGIPLLIYSHKAITVHKGSVCVCVWGGGGGGTLIHVLFDTCVGSGHILV